MLVGQVIGLGDGARLYEELVWFVRQRPPDEAINGVVDDDVGNVDCPWAKEQAIDCTTDRRPAFAAAKDVKRRAARTTPMPPFQGRG